MHGVEESKHGDGETVCDMDGEGKGDAECEDSDV